MNINNKIDKIIIIILVLLLTISWYLNYKNLTKKQIEKKDNTLSFITNNKSYKNINYLSCLKEASNSLVV